jgi:RHS repeat-associated protein
MYNEQMDYDKNGNIQSLKRNGDFDSNYLGVIVIDDLAYTYDSNLKNQLMSVTDGTNNPKGFKDLNVGNADYEYDANGNMIRDDNKNISTIFYNHLNLPTQINFTTGDKIDYLYDATGQKKSKKVTQGGIETVTDYLDGYQYTNEKLSFFPHAEGFVNVSICSECSEGNQQKFNYVYNYTDHLGNIRVSYSLDKIDNGLKILEENHYYPFGLKHTKYNSGNKEYVEPIIGEAVDPSEFGKRIVQVSSLSRIDYKYKYNGKEYQDELGLNWYDFGARGQMPDIGRMNNMDALAENYYPVSPYSYALNNPNYFIDPDGNYIEIYYGEGSKEHQRYEYQKDRDYSKIDSPFLADALKALDAVYQASNIEVDGETVNIMDGIMNSEKELSVAKSCEDCGSNFGSGRAFKDRNNNSASAYNNIGTIYFDNKNGVLFDDVKDSKSDVLQQQLATGKFAKTAKINSPTSLFGHEMGHAFGFFTDPSSYFKRKEDKSSQSKSPYFKNQEEAKATTLSTQINIQLKENPRLNHRGVSVPTQNVLSNKRL